jgi:hypothetical protein
VMRLILFALESLSKLSIVKSLDIMLILGKLQSYKDLMLLSLHLIR